MTELDTLAALGRELAEANSRRSDVVARARAAAQAAYAAGFTQKDIAATLGVDRARTLRRWLGKA